MSLKIFSKFMAQDIVSLSNVSKCMAQETMTLLIFCSKYTNKQNMATHCNSNCK